MYNVYEVFCPILLDPPHPPKNRASFMNVPLQELLLQFKRSGSQRKIYDVIVCQNDNALTDKHSSYLSTGFFCLTTLKFFCVCNM